jgi:hypothetical protein
MMRVCECLVLTLAFGCTRGPRADEERQRSPTPLASAVQPPASVPASSLQRCLETGERYGNLDSLKHRLGSLPPPGIRQSNDSASGASGQILTYTWPGLRFQIFRRLDGQQLPIALTAGTRTPWLSCDVWPGASATTVGEVLGTPSWTYALVSDTTLWAFEDDPVGPSFQLHMYRDTVRATAWVYYLD